MKNLELQKIRWTKIKESNNDPVDFDFFRKNTGFEDEIVESKGVTMPRKEKVGGRRNPEYFSKTCKSIPGNGDEHRYFFDEDDFDIENEDEDDFSIDGKEGLDDLDIDDAKNEDDFSVDGKEGLDDLDIDDAKNEDDLSVDDKEGLDDFDIDEAKLSEWAKFKRERLKRMKNDFDVFGDFLKSTRKDDDDVNDFSEGDKDNSGVSESESNDNFFEEVKELCAEKGYASLYLLQKEFNMGFNRAKGILAKMEALKLIAPYEGNSNRSWIYEEVVDNTKFEELESEDINKTVLRRPIKSRVESKTSGKARAEFAQIAKYIRGKDVTLGEELAKLILEGKLPMQSARGIKRLFEVAADRSGISDKQTFSKQIRALLDLPHEVYGETYDDFAALEKELNDKILFSSPAINKLIRAYKAHLEGDTLRGNVVLIVGPPKSGKSTLIQAFGEIARQYIYSYDCNGVTESCAFDGSSYTYSNGNPSLIVNILIESGIINPFVILENVDKMFLGGRLGDPANVLAKWLNKRTNHSYQDAFLSVPIDISSVNYILTAEKLEYVSPVLRNQATIIEMGSYEQSEKVTICTSSIVKQTLTELELDDSSIVFEPEAVVSIINEKAFQPGLAELVKIVEDIVNKEVENAKFKQIVITPQYVEKYFSEGNFKEILRLTDSKYESLRLLASRLPNYTRKEQDKIIAKVKENEYDLQPHEEKFYDLLSRYPRGTISNTPKNFEEIETMAKGYYGALESKEQLLTLLAKNILTDKQEGIIIGLIGNPGVGKTHFAQFAAQLLDRSYVAISMANVVDPSEITGIRNHKIGKIAEAFIKAGTENPLILIDELEKASMEVQNGLLAYLDPLQNQDLTDEYLEINVPIQQAIVIATVNNMEKLSYPVYDRLEKIFMEDYTVADKVEISKRGTIKNYTLSVGLPEGSIIFPDDILRSIAKSYGVGQGYRQMERVLRKIIGTCAREVLSKNLDKESYCKTITEEYVFDCLGEPIIRDRKVSGDNKVGVVYGLAAGSLCGDVLPIEATIYPGKGEFELTGSLGEVMRESAKVAKAVIRKMLIDENSSVDINKIGIHLHAPDGAQKKEGPSAGMAIAIALYSAITTCKVKGKYAMSGEINLQGEILAVGGLESKLTAAFECDGVEMILLPEENRKDVDKLDNPYIDKSQICYISTLSEALDILLAREPKSENTEAR